MREIFAQMTLNQNKGREYEEEEPRPRRRRSPNSREQTEGWYSPYYNEQYFPPHLRDYHRCRYEPFPREPRVDLPPYFGRDYVEEFSDWR